MKIILKIYSHFSFNRSKELITHMRVHSGLKPFNCSICGKNFVGSDTLSKHIKTHTGEKNYACEYCMKSFTLKNQLKIHMRKHTGEKPYACNFENCNRKFATTHSLNMHIPVHENNRCRFNFQYHFMNLWFNTAFSGRTSASPAVNHSPVNKTRKSTKISTIARAMFVLGSAVVALITVSLASKNIWWRTREKNMLYVLIAVHKYIFYHQPQLTYPRSIVHFHFSGKSFARKADLKRHILTHTQERPFKCNHCGKGFNQQYGLTQHLRYHEGSITYIIFLYTIHFHAYFR